MFVIETTRLQLRKPSWQDMRVLRDLWKNENVRQYLGGVISDEEIDEKIMLLLEHWNTYGFGQCAVYDKNQSMMIGLCGLSHSVDGIELSYMFFPSSWGKGLAKEAACVIIANGFADFKFDKIISITQKANHRSCHLLNAIGMHCVDTFNRFNAVQCLYEVMQEKWQNMSIS